MRTNDQSTALISFTFRTSFSSKWSLKSTRYKVTTFLICKYGWSTGKAKNFETCVKIANSLFYIWKNAWGNWFCSYALPWVISSWEKICGTFYQRCFMQIYPHYEMQQEISDLETVSTLYRACVMDFIQAVINCWIIAIVTLRLRIAKPQIIQTFFIKYLNFKNACDSFNYLITLKLQFPQKGVVRLICITEVK